MSPFPGEFRKCKKQLLKITVIFIVFFFFNVFFSLLSLYLLVIFMPQNRNMREKWMNIVQEQKAIHDNELAKWQQFIKLTADLLKKVKIIYSELVSDKTDKNDEL